MEWLSKQVSIYSCAADNTGRAATLRDILFADFALPHEWYFKQYKPEEKWINGTFNDLETIIDLRNREITKEEKLMLKLTLQCFTPAGLLKTKKKGSIEVISYSGLMQFDWDAKALEGYDLREVMQAVFELPFIAFCGLSCSGTGFYALAAIEEPGKLEQYAEHCFVIFERYGLPLDTSKGANVNDLRYVSYDSEMMIRENPEPLKVSRFLKRKQPETQTSQTRPTFTINHSSKIVQNSLFKVRDAMEGTRWQTIQQVAYTLGGIGDDSLLNEIKDTIRYSAQFAGVEEKYMECATVCFQAGKQNPLL